MPFSNLWGLQCHRDCAGMKKVCFFSTFLTAFHKKLEPTIQVGQNSLKALGFCTKRRNRCNGGKTTFWRRVFLVQGCLGAKKKKKTQKRSVLLDTYRNLSLLLCFQLSVHALFHCLYIHWDMNMCRNHSCWNINPWMHSDEFQSYTRCDQLHRQEQSKDKCPIRSRSAKVSCSTSDFRFGSFFFLFHTTV